MPFLTRQLNELHCLEFIKQAPFALVIADDKREVILANQCAEALLGYVRGELLGKNVSQLWGDRVFDSGASPEVFPEKSMCRRIDIPNKQGELIALECMVQRLKVTDRILNLAYLKESATYSRADEQQMAAIIESTDDAVLTKSLDGTIRSWNPGAERLLGYRAEEVIGGPIARLIPRELLDQETMIIDRLRRGERVAHFETVRRRKDGHQIDVSLTISPIRNQDGIVVGASKIMRDISARKRAETELLRSNLELQRINTELDEFVYTASHDLRSPLTNIAAVAQWILDDDATLSEKTQARLRVIQGRIERMKKLLSDIRDYARCGEYMLGEPITAMQLLNDAIDGLNVPQGFSVRGDAELDKWQTQRVPLGQILHNLIDNAIKHHDRDHGTIVVSVDRNGPLLRFAVTDDGPGIPPEYREEIFGMFKTLKPKDQVEGSGMGLALVRKIVTRMGGACGVEAANGRGATFWFDWPSVPRADLGDHT